MADQIGSVLNKEEVAKTERDEKHVVAAFFALHQCTGISIDQLGHGIMEGHLLMRTWQLGDGMIHVELKEGKFALNPRTLFALNLKAR
jgi:hypothetical protein